MRTDHPIHRRYRAEDLVRARRAGEQQRYAASQRRGRIDPNPHQIDAVVFALERIPSGGCILADEVGLGKTIETGLVIAQLLAEGARRVLVIVPKPLLGQWTIELYTLFQLEAREVTRDPESIVGDGIFLVGRELAGSEHGAELLRSAEPFELVVIDEAHEIFANIHRRYDRHGIYRQDAPTARMAHRVKMALGDTPKLLLTATPLQNSLVELWGLLQYIEPTGTLLGNLATFREMFCDGDDRTLVVAERAELRQRLGSVLQRTLRRQAQEFLEQPFVDRRALLIEYTMGPAARLLYDDVTSYLLEPDLHAFHGPNRQLLLLGFHRRMASSLPALGASLQRVAARLQKLLDGAAPESLDEEVRAFAADLEDDELIDGLVPGDGDPTEATAPGPDRARVRAELAQVQDFIRRAGALAGDEKAAKLLEAERLIRERAARGEGSGKVVVFTESLTTQDYLRRVLIENGIEDSAITVFRGNNDSPRAREALGRWETEVAGSHSHDRRPSRQVAIRLALVHEFATRTRVFLSTEAGAKGLNLQFCDTLVNYNLPWNPQRIEQRIGRCHRYSQTRDVTVINFIARDNQAERLLFHILMAKLDLFGTVLDASDVVLHEARTETPEAVARGLGADFESRLRRIYERARTRDEIQAELEKLRETMEVERRAFDQAMTRTRGLIETRLDETVRQSFRRIQEQLPESLAELDRELEAVATGYLTTRAVPHELREEDGHRLLAVAASPLLPAELAAGATLVIGSARGVSQAEPLHLGHPLIRAAVAEAREATPGATRVLFTPAADGPAAVHALRGRRGRMVVTRVRHNGFEPVDSLLITALLEEELEPLPAEVARALLRSPARDAPPDSPPTSIKERDIDDAVAEAVFDDQARMAPYQQVRFERMIQQLERAVEDQVTVLRRRQAEVERRFRSAEDRLAQAIGADQRGAAELNLTVLQNDLDELATAIAELVARRDDSYQRWRDQAHARRYAQPELVRVIDLELTVA